MATGIEVLQKLVKAIFGPKLKSVCRSESMQFDETLEDRFDGIHLLVVVQELPFLPGVLTTPILPWQHVGVVFDAAVDEEYDSASNEATRKHSELNENIGMLEPIRANSHDRAEGENGTQ